MGKWTPEQRKKFNETRARKREEAKNGGATPHLRTTTAPANADDAAFAAFIDGVQALNRVTQSGWLMSTRQMLALIDAHTAKSSESGS